MTTLAEEFKALLNRYPMLRRTREALRIRPKAAPDAAVSVSAEAGFDGKLRTGQGCYFGPDTKFDISGDISVGDGVVFGQECLVLTHLHPNYAPDHLTASPLVIGDRAFIGDRVIVLPQVSVIGKHAVIGAGSVVTRDVPDMAVVAGNPARVIRMRELEVEQ